MTNNEIIKALECCSSGTGAEACKGCPFNKKDICDKEDDAPQKYALYLINRQKAEIERLRKLQKPTETSGFKIENGKVVFYTNILNGYRHEYKDLEEIVKELNLMLQSCYKCDEVVSHYKGNLKTAKTEAIKEFAERLKTKVSLDLCEAINCSDYLYDLPKLIDNLVKEMTEQSTGYGLSKTEGNG